jgi:hypothetical protein
VVGRGLNPTIQKQLVSAGKILDPVVQPPGGDHAETVIDIQAVDDHMRVTRARFPGANTRNDRAILIDDGFGL